MSQTRETACDVLRKQSRGNVYPIHLTLCSAVSAWLRDRSNICSRQPSFDLSHYIRVNTYHVLALTPCRPPTTLMIIGEGEKWWLTMKFTPSPDPGFDPWTPCTPAPWPGDARHANRPQPVQHLAGYMSSHPAKHAPFLYGFVRCGRVRVIKPMKNFYCINFWHTDWPTFKGILRIQIPTA